ncbi:MAG: aspartate aminotransferase family protein [Thermogemmatispora sp.]|uniref:(R)-1-hydroxy-2-aminoethylphosphonate ammonia-lyase n=1 Tax=Thermogemmatispora sp. TaxID=1968838 RepID=UPI001A056D4E|nr:aspartate aminotransferase family protein [Thermogemmatispora sp.]MBE3567542.1 aspartate aminotransferase family protein [Thermogemmatispora sp.]
MEHRKWPYTVSQEADEARVEGDINTTPARQRWYARLPEQTRALLDEDARWFLHQSLSTPCLNALRAASGCYLEAVDGRLILDFHGNNVHQIGYAHPHVVQAVCEQLQRLPFTPRRYTNELVVRLAAALAQRAPGDDNWKVLFAPGAAEAVSMALKLARRVTGRYKVLSFWGSFHGATLDTIAVGGEALFRRGLGPLLPGVVHAPPCRPRGCPFGCPGTCSLRCVDYLDYVMQQDGEIGAVLVETVRNTEVWAPPSSYYPALRQVCTRHGALLILDETAVALGRTGKMFAIEHYDCLPDMIVLGKGLGGGVFPLAALLARSELDCVADTAIGHFTHEKTPVGAAAGLATLQVLAEEGLIERAARLGPFFAAQLSQRVGHFPCVGALRQIGLLFALDIIEPHQPGHLWPAGAEAILYAALERGLSFKLGGGCTLTLSPTLIVSEQQWQDACQILSEAMSSVLSTSALPGGE